MQPFVQPEVAVIVVAAGSGVRLGHAEPKAFVRLAGRSILEHSLAAIAALAEPVQVVVVAPDSHVAEASIIADRALGADAHLSVVAGGASRHASVEAGLAKLETHVDIVLIHDAARALTPTNVFDRVIASVRAHRAGALPVLPVADSIKRVDGDLVTASVERSELAAAQTPQGFPRQQLIEAYVTAAGHDYTDDAGVYTNAGLPVHTVEGSDLAFKITTASDLDRAEQIARVLIPLSTVTDSVSRVGVGVDTHAFGTEKGLWLAGLHWPDEDSLAGHSDGDAVAHALCDALLSAAGLGDIGGLFGTDDPAFAGAHGDVFVRAAVAKLREAGWVPVNVSVQMVGNRPKLAPRRDEAQSVLSEWVGAPVSLGATTTDGLGFTGRGQGIAAVATALIARV